MMEQNSSRGLCALELPNPVDYRGRDLGLGSDLARVEPRKIDVLAVGSTRRQKCCSTRNSPARRCGWATGLDLIGVLRNNSPAPVELTVSVQGPKDGPRPNLPL